jgi:hypothetical protein
VALRPADGGGRGVFDGGDWGGDRNLGMGERRKRKMKDEREKGDDMWSPRRVSSTSAKPLNKITE